MFTLCSCKVKDAVYSIFADAVFCWKPRRRRGMVHAIFHWHAVWHVVVGIGCFVFWSLLNGLGHWGETKAYADQMEAEKRGRERIMESYDLDRREDGMKPPHHA